jgi:hypothetical protein
MKAHRLLEIEDRYWGVEIFECPSTIMLAAVRLGFEYVTIENFRHYRNWKNVTIELVSPQGERITPTVSRFDFDFQITKDEFLRMETLWNSQGCYAVFHREQPIKFKITHLEGIKRYRALDNFQWNLELAIPDSASDGWGRIVSPDKRLIDIVIQEIDKGR